MEYTTEIETPAYALAYDRLGFFYLIRKSDGKSAYFQGDDALLWRENIDAVHRSGRHADANFNVLCAGYDDILSEGE